MIQDLMTAVRIHLLPDDPGFPDAEQYNEVIYGRKTDRNVSFGYLWKQRSTGFNDARMEDPAYVWNLPRPAREIINAPL